MEDGTFKLISLHDIRQELDERELDAWLKLIRIYISLNPERRPEIAISNNGQPIPEDLKERIFIPFFTTKESGSGIGLSLCRQIVFRMGGRIRVESSEDHTVFIITL